MNQQPIQTLPKRGQRKQEIRARNVIDIEDEDVLRSRDSTISLKCMSLAETNELRDRYQKASHVAERKTILAEVRHRRVLQQSLAPTRMTESRSHPIDQSTQIPDQGLEDAFLSQFVSSPTLSETPGFYVFPNNNFKDLITTEMCTNEIKLQEQQSVPLSNSSSWLDKGKRQVLNDQRFDAYEQILGIRLDHQVRAAMLFIDQKYKLAQ
ncbi:hypothetical protein CROQUDRAFT_707259 [Cronartium quercuum f. sp. fusiforme G11]|uniref:Uncharacterized protein n=1 Tax=Cronartium quercuum f. sp. fusiforme G11 TaxID=708437 RepID=A0A9P6NIW8_9BASI|nr:hypothetical protein CROQUDRAFT_707259 [Cronartium quercuum f. sp. fusiforme G11]